LGGILASRRLAAAIGVDADARLTPTKLRALDALAENGALRVSELAARMSVDETTGTRLADRLEAAGLARRERDPDDRRATAVVLTPAGRRIAAEMAGRRLEFFRDVIAALDPGERAELVRLTRKATAALREELIAR
ncbi:MAG: MarR family winged helix-turn-helix transcriptional regulator, partial [Gaiellaceae bacterium]